MINEIVLNTKEFESLELKTIGSHAGKIIYSSIDPKKFYLLGIEHDVAIGNYYKGICITRETGSPKFIMLHNDKEVVVEKGKDNKGYNMKIDKVGGNVSYEERKSNRPTGGGW